MAYGNSVAFNGSTQYGKLPNFSGLDGLDLYTIEMWVYRSSSSSAYDDYFNISNGAGTYFMGFQCENGANSDGLNWYTQYSGTNADGYKANGSGAVAANTWTHIAITHESDDKSHIFINGSEISYNLQQTGSGTLQDSTGLDLWLALYNDASDYMPVTMGGFIRVWNAVRTEAELAANKNVWLDPSLHSDLIVNCNLSEGSGSTLDNNASAGDDITLYNSPTWATSVTDIGDFATEDGSLNINVVDRVFAADNLSTVWHQEALSSNIGDGTLSGNATLVYANAGGYVRLTAASNSQSGAISWNDTTNFPNTVVEMEFDFWAGGGDGADAVFAFINTTSVPGTETDGNGGYIAYWSEYHDEAAVYYNGGSIGSTGFANLDNSTWRHGKIVVNGTSVKMYTDGSLTLDITDSARSFTGGYVGVAARTGGLNNEHRVKNLVIRQLPQDNYVSVTTPAANLEIDVSDEVTVGEAINVAKSVNTLVDRFNDNTWDTDVWDRSNTTDIREANNVLEMETVLAGNYIATSSTELYDLTNGAFYVEIVDPGDYTESTMDSYEAYPLQFVQGGNVIEFLIGYSTIYAYTGAVERASTGYNPTTMRWLQIRETSGTLYMEYSADGANWTTLWSESTPFAINKGQVNLVLGTWQAEATTSVLQLRNLNFNFREISVSDEVTVGESVSLEVISYDTNINVSDEITVGESVDVAVSAPSLSVSDEVTVGEDYSVVVSGPQINVSDEITVGENINVEIPIEINVSDNVGVFEGPTLWDDDFSGDLSGYTQAAGTWQITSGVLDPVTQTGTDWQNSLIHVSDLIVTNFEALVDFQKGANNSQIIFRSGTGSGSGYGIQIRNDLSSRSFRLENWGNSNLQEVDSGITWNTGTWYRIRIKVEGWDIKAKIWPKGTTEPTAWNIEYTDAGTLFASGYIGFSNENELGSNFDNLTVFGNPNVYVNTNLSVSDEVTVSESVNLKTDNPLTASDEVTVGEEVSIQVSGPQVSAGDTITVGESVNLEIVSGISVSDEVTVGEDLNVEVETQISVSDEVTVSESVSLTVIDDTKSLNVSDEVTVDEAVKVEVNSNIGVSDEVTVGEVVSLEMADALKINVSDEITVSESVVPDIQTQINVSDEVTVGEAISIVLPDALKINVTDTITLSENVSMQGSDLAISVSDEVTLSESVQAQPNTEINVSDEVTVGEVSNAEIKTGIVVSDSVTVGESVNVSLPDALKINVSDSVTVGESINPEVLSVFESGIISFSVIVIDLGEILIQV